MVNLQDRKYKAVSVVGCPPFIFVYSYPDSELGLHYGHMNAKRIAGYPILVSALFNEPKSEEEIGRVVSDLVCALTLMENAKRAAHNLR